MIYIYLDDWLIVGRSEEETADHLRGDEGRRLHYKQRKILFYTNPTNPVSDLPRSGCRPPERRGLSLAQRITAQKKQTQEIVC